MEETLKLQGRTLTPYNLTYITTLMKQNPDWGRSRLSQELCRAWNWITPYGQLKDMACRTMLLKLERRGYLTLPPRKAGRKKNTSNASLVLHDTKEVSGKLKDVIPLKVSLTRDRHDRDLFKTYMALYHYLGLNTVVGENLQYLISSREGVPLACLLFGACAWKTAPRDNYIGWIHEERKKNLFLIANNHRYLIFPWVKVKFLASHILSLIVKRLSDDWENKYCHPIVLAETFVERDRFAGTCYKAAGWHYVGDTQGRGKDDVHVKCDRPIKKILVYPLHDKFRQQLRSTSL